MDRALIFMMMVNTFGKLDIGSPQFWQVIEQNVIKHVPNFQKKCMVPFAEGVLQSTKIENESVLYKFVEIILIQNFNKAKLLEKYNDLNSDRKWLMQKNEDG